MLTGGHSFVDLTTVTTRVAGREDAVLWGRWSLQPMSSGAMRDVTVALDCRAPTNSMSAV
jgi:hypothetical protein